MISLTKEEKYTALKLESICFNIAAIQQEVTKANTNIIIDAASVTETSDTELEALQSIYEAQAEGEKSFIIANLLDTIWDQAEDADIELNVAPTLNEAIDILFMEELERELL